MALLLWASAAPLWALFWAIWTGRLRWMTGHTAEIAVTVLPGTAASWTLMGLAAVVGQPWLFWLGAATFAVGIVLMIVEAIAEPRWLQPAWYREEQVVARDPRGLGGALQSPAARRPPTPSVALEPRVDDPDDLLAAIKDRAAALRRVSAEAADPRAGGPGEGTRRRRPRPD